MPDDINAVIIDYVLNGLEVYGSGRRLARAVLPISGHVHFIISAVIDNRLPADAQLGRHLHACPPTWCHDALTLETHEHDSLVGHKAALL